MILPHSGLRLFHRLLATPFLCKDASVAAACWDSNFGSAAKKAAAGAGTSLRVAVARLLQTHSRTLYSLETEAKVLKTSQRHLLRMMCAVAEHCTQTQRMTLEAVLSYVQVLCSYGDWRPTLYLEHRKFDETPLALQVRFGGPEGVEQVAKTFVVEHAWCILLTRKRCAGADDCVILRGSGSPAIRVSQNTTGETIAQLVAGCVPAPASLRMFATQWRLTETDAAKANFRAERVGTTTAQVAHAVCSAHRCHQVATKTWTLELQTLSALKRSLLVLESPTYYLKFRDTMIAVIKDRLVLKRSSVLPPQALSFRQAVLRLYSPTSHRSRAHSTVRVFAEDVLNGNWMNSKEVEHYCSGCCTSERDTHLLIERWVPRVLKALSLRRFCKANWTSWQLPLCVVGFWMHVHNLWNQVFLQAFSPVRDALRVLGEAQLDEGADESQRWQVEMAQNLTIALSSWGERGAEASSSMYVLRSSLQAECEAMATLLENTAAKAVHREMFNVISEGS